MLLQISLMNENDRSSAVDGGINDCGFKLHDCAWFCNVKLVFCCCCCCC